ncbi:MAG: 4Fe-4S binding protein [Deltaproteobacteria bacterium]|nr:4Fe-4S binding protein [Deltaproteobacteria bacterium]
MSPVKYCKYVIMEDRCKNCGACLEVCLDNAIKRSAEEVCEINEKLCTHCGLCMEACQVSAIKKKFSISVLMGNLTSAKERSENKYV